MAVLFPILTFSSNIARDIKPWKDGESTEKYYISGTCLSCYR